MSAFAVILWHDPAVESENPEAEMAAHQRHSDELQAEGNMTAAIALGSHDLTTSIRPGDIVTDGPFIESKEVIAGLYVLEASDLDQAIATARRNPILSQGGGLEVRPIEGYFMRPNGGSAGTDDSPN